MNEKRFDYACPKCKGTLKYQYENHETITLSCENCKHLIMVRKMPPLTDIFSPKPIEIERNTKYDNIFELFTSVNETMRELKR